jgi:methionine-rich copper-binding protein CopC
MRTKQSFLVSLGSCVSVLLLASAVWGHARLIRSEPKDRAVLDHSPSAVHLWFNELLDRGFHAIEVFPAEQRGRKERQNLTAGPVVVDAEDRTHISVPLQPLPPGEYVVEYRVLSRDGHTAPGRIGFRVTAVP